MVNKMNRQLHHKKLRQKTYRGKQRDLNLVLAARAPAGPILPAELAQPQAGQRRSPSPSFLQRWPLVVKEIVYAPAPPSVAVAVPVAPAIVASAAVPVAAAAAAQPQCPPQPPQPQL
nr:oleosin-B6-like [Penaeus vannamei]